MLFRSRIARRLGPELAGELEKGITSAVAAGRVELGTHAAWIEALLVQYYDKSYLHAFRRVSRQVVFRGSLEECRQWILHRYA